MPSAKMVEQKPAGNFSPLSFCGHAAAVGCGAAADASGDACELPADRAAKTADTAPRYLHRREEGIDQPPWYVDATILGRIKNLAREKANNATLGINVAAVTIETSTVGCRYGCNAG